MKLHLCKAVPSSGITSCVALEKRRRLVPSSVSSMSTFVSRFVCFRIKYKTVGLCNGRACVNCIVVVDHAVHYGVR